MLEQSIGKMSDFGDQILHPLNFKGKLPPRFTFPFYYDLHPLAELAVEHLQQFLNTSEWRFDFGLDQLDKVGDRGKMFGVLVVKDDNENLGYLAAFSGKLFDTNDVNGFVPPIFDMLDDEGFYRKGEEELNGLNAEIDRVQNEAEFIKHQNKLKCLLIEKEGKIKDLKNELKLRKEKRKAIRQNLINSDHSEIESEFILLENESKRDHFRLKDEKRKWQLKIQTQQLYVHEYSQRIESLKQKRKHKSNSLQQMLFDQYNFLNASGEILNVRSVFKNHNLKSIPSGAGDCAAPKLLQFAYDKGYTPLCMAEFWWGQSLPSQVRKHKTIYPSCKSKCRPILTHMLGGLKVDPNPILNNFQYDQDLPVLYEDEFLLVINKPSGMLSIPGKEIFDSVHTRLSVKYPEATGPLLVHRLDQSTSGLLLIGKTKEVHKQLQKQFLDRTIRKTYFADLMGRYEGDSQGIVELPLRVDLDNRPYQMVCREFGKDAVTKFEIESVDKNHTRVKLIPITGRTHQLRVHMAHPLGLGMPMLGDDLYGEKADRLHLHASILEFQHPVLGKSIKVESPVPF